MNEKEGKKKQCISFKQPLNAYLSWRGSSFSELNARHFSWLYIFAMLGHLFFVEKQKMKMMFVFCQRFNFKKIKVYCGENLQFIKSLTN